MATVAPNLIQQQQPPIFTPAQDNIHNQNQTIQSEVNNNSKIEGKNKNTQELMSNQETKMDLQKNSDQRENAATTRISALNQKIPQNTQDLSKALANANVTTTNFNGANKQTANNIGNRTIGHYIVGKTLGQGTFGKVRLGTHNLTGEKVAIKILEKDKIIDKADVERVTREIHILKIVRHPNVIQLYEIIETNRQLFLIMEYANGGELFDYIVKRKRLQDKEACKFFQQLLSGIEYLHKIKVCHRDLKPENLLLDENKNIKIVDFGLSNTYKVGETLKTACGSPCYAAPEMIAGKRYHGLNADIWSSGVILYAMACGYLPFEDPNTNKLYKKILNCDYLIPGFISQGCKDLIKKILNTDPSARLKISEIRNHEWYQQISSVEMEGIVVGQDHIPVIDDVKQLIDEGQFQLEDIDMTEKYIKNNKHNPITATYYLLIKKTERETGKNLVFERVTKEKRSYNSTGNLGQVSKNPLQQTAMYFRGNSQQITNIAKQSILNQTAMDGFKFNSQQKSDSKNTRTGRDNSFNVGKSEFFRNLNPVTKQYLKKIENAYVNRNDSISSNQEEEGSKSKVGDKYQKFRDTVDVGKWIQQGYNKGQSAMNTASQGDSSFMEQRLNRNGKPIKYGEQQRATSNDNKLNFSIFQPSHNSFMKDGLPIVSPNGGAKHNQNKSLQHRLTMYNYNPQQNSGSNSQIKNQNQLFGQIQGQKFNLSNLNTVKNNHYDMNGRKIKLNNNSNTELNDSAINDYQSSNIILSSGPINKQNQAAKNSPPKKLPESNFSMYTIYRPKVGNQNAFLNNMSFANEKSDSSLDRKNHDAVNHTVIEKAHHNKLLSELYSTSGKKFYNSNVPYNKLISTQNSNQQQQVFHNNIVLPFQVNSGIKTSTTKQLAQSSYSNQAQTHLNIMQRKNNESSQYNNNSTTDTSVGGQLFNLSSNNIKNQTESILANVSKINQNILFNQKGDFRVKLATNNNGIMINSKKTHLNNRKILIL